MSTDIGVLNPLFPRSVPLALGLLGGRSDQTGQGQLLSFRFFYFILFEGRDLEEELPSTDSLPNACNRQGWTRRKSESPYTSPTRVAGTQVPAPSPATLLGGLEPGCWGSEPQAGS